MATNMSYCRFRNTVCDLVDCIDNWDNDLSDKEEEARQIMINLAKTILEYEGIEINED